MTELLEEAALRALNRIALDFQVSFLEPQYFTTSVAFSFTARGDVAAASAKLEAGRSRRDQSSKMEALPLGETGDGLPSQICEWARDDRLRHPVFLGLREDKNTSDVVHEKAS